MTSTAIPAVRRTGALVAAVTLAATALWAPASTATTRVPSSEDDRGKLMLVLDSSGSMAEPASGGQTKIAAAKTALRSVIGTLPAGAAVGLRVYGAEVFSKRLPGACTDTQRVVPIASHNQAALRTAITRYRPYGETPIGYALREAAKDLGSEGQRTIVLVSDGEATCPPPPCEVAADIAKQGIDIKIDVVGLDVSGSAREQLACIAAAGRGTYYDADDADELASALDKLSTRAFRPFELTGQRVQGTHSPDSAPVLTAGDYVTDMGPDDSWESFRLRRSIPGSTLHVGVSGLSPDSTDGLILAAYPLPLPDNEFDHCGRVIPGFGLEQGSDLFGVSITVDPRSYSTEEGCTDDEVLLYLERGQGDNGFGGNEPIDVELIVVEEPPVPNMTALPAAVSEASWVAPRVSGRAQKAVGGASFADAATVDAGTYRSDIVPGETVVYRAFLEWGQRATFQIRFPSRGPALAEALGRFDVTAVVKAYTPTRGEIDYNGIEGPGTSGLFDAAAPLTLGVTTPEVRYLNRSNSDLNVAVNTSLPGYYYLTLRTTPDDEGQNYTVPFFLDVDIVGEPDQGPDYLDVPEPSTTPSGTPGDTATDTPGTTATPASPSGPATSPTSTSDTSTATRADSGEDDHTRTLLLTTGAGVAGITALTAALALLRRRTP
ncbi:MAG: VWA domain-containing protein [Propionibacteriales bacterium]|nr:VWA domain-containing protein [Propionibacteriales bacterium]